MSKKPTKLSGTSYNAQEDLTNELKIKLPEIFAEGKIDCKRLKNTLGDFVDDESERYGLNWAGKTNCFRHIQESTTATLKPDKDESVDFDHTQNLFIEGDNLEVLKVLQRSYYGKIKMIYIDPPYNTGNDFVYNDTFKQDRREYEQAIGDMDEEGNLRRDGLVQNRKDNGHYHSNWLNTMYPRLFLAKNLLRQDGVIFVSIDDHEVHNLHMIMNEIFGEENFIGCVTRVAKKTSNQGTHYAPSKDYVFTYAKNIQLLAAFKEPVSKEYLSRFKGIDDKGNFNTVGLYQAALDPLRGCSNQRYFIKCPDGSLVIPPGKNFPEVKKDGEKIAPLVAADKVWRWSVGRYLTSKDYLVFKKTKNSPLVNENGEQSNWNIYTKYYLDDRIEDGTRPRDYLDNLTNDLGTKDLKQLDLDNYFSFPKPIALVKYLCKIIGLSKDDTILDFFAGSCTTAHAVMQLNTEDNENRKFICVQLPEVTEEDGEAHKAGYKTIAEIGKERIRRAGKKIKQEYPDSKVDFGFKVFKLDQSNFKIWRGDVQTAEELGRQINMFVDNLQKGSAKENILYELMLKSGMDLNVPITKKKTTGKEYYVLNSEDGLVVICLEDEITANLIELIIAEKPVKFICLDRSFKGNDQLKTNTHLQLQHAKVEFKVV